MKDLNDILAMAQNVQAEMQKAQAALDTIEVEGAAGGGLVKIRATAKGRIIAVTIDDSLLAPSEKQMVEDLVAAAINDARAKADAASSAEMGKLTAGMPLPEARATSKAAAGHAAEPAWPMDCAESLLTPYPWAPFADAFVGKRQSLPEPVSALATRLLSWCVAARLLHAGGAVQRRTDG